jgi:hypothetical protein
MRRGLRNPPTSKESPSPFASKIHPKTVSSKPEMAKEKLVLLY